MGRWIQSGKTQERVMARFWLLIANSIGILIFILLLIWMVGSMK